MDRQPIVVAEVLSVRGVKRQCSCGFEVSAMTTPVVVLEMADHLIAAHPGDEIIDFHPFVVPFRSRPSDPGVPALR